MRCFDAPASDVERRRDQLRHFEQLEPRARARHVDYRIDGADLVEVNFGRRLVVQLALRLGDPAKDLDRPLFCCLRQRAAFDELLDVAQVALRLLLRYHNFHARSREPRAQDVRLLEFVVA